MGTYLLIPVTPLQFRKAGDYIFSLGGYSLREYVEYIPSPYTIIGAMISSMLSVEPTFRSSLKYRMSVNNIEDYFKNYKSQISEFIKRLIGPIACLVDPRNYTIINLLLPSPYDMFVYEVHRKGYLGFMVPVISDNRTLFHVRKAYYEGKEIYVHFADDKRCTELKGYLVREDVFKSYIQQEEGVYSKYSIIELKSTTRLRIAMDRIKKVTQFFAFRPLTPPGALYYVTQSHYEVIDLDRQNLSKSRYRVALLADLNVCKKFKGILNEAMFTLGGREGIAYMERIEISIIEKLISLFRNVLDKISEEKIARIIFLTPPIASDRQTFLNYIVKELEKKGFKNPCILTSFYEEDSISGFDLRLAMNKPLTYSLRPGSVMIVRFQ